MFVFENRFRYLTVIFRKLFWLGIFVRNCFEGNSVYNLFVPFYVFYNLLLFFFIIVLQSKDRAAISVFHIIVCINFTLRLALVVGAYQIIDTQLHIIQSVDDNLYTVVNTHNVTLRGT